MSSPKNLSKKGIIVLCAVFVVSFAILWIAEKNNVGADEDIITVSVSDTDLKNANYEEVSELLKKDGFTNIKCEPLYDIYLGIMASEGESESITINGLSEFEKGDKFPKDTEIIIKYHLSYKNDPANSETTSADTEKSLSETEIQTSETEKETAQSSEISSATETEPAETSQLNDSVFYSTNNSETIKNGDTGIYSYIMDGPQYDIYYIIDFDEGCVYYFSEGNGYTEADRLKIDTGTLNDNVVITYHDIDAVWSYKLHFESEENPEHLIMIDNDGFEIDFYATNLDEALKLKNKKEIKDW